MYKFQSVSPIGNEQFQYTCHVNHGDVNINYDLIKIIAIPCLVGTLVRQKIRYSTYWHQSKSNLSGVLVQEEFNSFNASHFKVDKMFSSVFCIEALVENETANK